MAKTEIKNPVTAALKPPQPYNRKTYKRNHFIYE